MGSGKAAANRMIDEFDSRFLVCRTLLHMFDESTSRVERDGSKYRWSLDCSRCQTVRTKILDRQGRIVGSVYKYPKGYTRPGIGRLDSYGSAHLRLHVILDVLGGV